MPRECILNKEVIIQTVKIPKFLQKEIKSIIDPIYKKQKGATIISVLLGKEKYTFFGTITKEKNK